MTESELAKTLMANPELRVMEDGRVLEITRFASGSTNPPKFSEHQMQAAIIEECDRRAIEQPEWGLLYAVPNGGYRGKAQGGKLKAEGVRAGMPDLHLPVARHSRIGLWLELKVGSNKPSELQLQRIRQLRVEGHCVEVVWDDPQEAIKILEWWIEG